MLGQNVKQTVMVYGDTKNQTIRTLIEPGHFPDFFDFIYDFMFLPLSCGIDEEAKSWLSDGNIETDEAGYTVACVHFPQPEWNLSDVLYIVTEYLKDRFEDKPVQVVNNAKDLTCKRSKSVKYHPAT